MCNIGISMPPHLFPLKNCFLAPSPRGLWQKTVFAANAFLHFESPLHACCTQAGLACCFDLGPPLLPLEGAFFLSSPFPPGIPEMSICTASIHYLKTCSQSRLPSSSAEKYCASRPMPCLKYRLSSDAASLMRLGLARD